MPYRILVSSNTDFVYTLCFSPTTGSLDLEHKTCTGHRPSWITPHPGDKSLIFTGLEQQEGKIVLLRFDNDGKGVVEKIISSGGSDPCSLFATESDLFVANYSGGGIAILPISTSPPYLPASSSPDTIVMSGNGPNKDRQTASHPHQVTLVEEYQELLVPDLGADKVWRLKKNSDGLWKLQGHVRYEPGSGPRHVVYYEGYLYTVCELANQVVKHRLPALPSEAEFITCASTMSNTPSPIDMFAGEILLPKPNSTFSTPYLYVSNRNDPSPEGDTIAIFSIVNPSRLELVNEVRTGLNHVRGMEFGGVNDKWLVVGGLNAGGVKVFERVDDGKGLKAIALNEDVAAPAGFLWT